MDNLRGFKRGENIVKIYDKNGRLEIEFKN